MANRINREAALLVAEGRGYAGWAYLSDIAAELGMPTSDLHLELHSLMAKQEVELVRADLTAALDKAKIRASEWQHPMLRSAVYHGVRPR